MGDDQLVDEHLALLRRGSDLLAATRRLDPREVAAYELGREHQRARMEAAADEVMGIGTLLPPGVAPPNGRAPRPEDLGGGYDDETLVDRLRAALVDTAGLDGLPEPVPLVDGILYLDTLAFVVGAPGDGKSLVMLDVAGHVGTGLTWHGYPVRQGVVLYLVAEGLHGVKGRVRAWERAAGQPMTNVRFLPVAVQAASDAEWQALCDLAAETRPVLVVLDTQARVTVGLDENSARDMGVFVARVERLRRACGATIVVVHHTPRNGENPRGSTALEGAADTILRVSREDQTVTITCRKQKDGRPVDEIIMRIIPSDTSVIVSLTDRPQETVSGSTTIMRAVSTWWEQHETDWVSVSTLVESKIFTKATFYRAAKPLQRQGIVEMAGEKNGRRYRLTRDPGDGAVSSVSGQSHGSHETGRIDGRAESHVSRVLRSGTRETRPPAGDSETAPEPLSDWAGDAYDRER